MSDAIPMRALGRTGAKVSALGFGGHHLGEAPDLKSAIELVHEAIDAGVTFFDNCWEYHNGRSEDWMGRALRGKRDKVFLMTKVCSHGRDAALATSMLEESLRRLGTDHLDLWQVHGVVFDDDPARACRDGGVLEALDAAKKAGKVRFVGFTGHKSPAVHLDMLTRGYAWDTVQMPLNPFDWHFRSFERQVVPKASAMGVACLGMKPMTGTPTCIQRGEITAEELLRYAMSLPVATTITGMEKPEILRQNVKIARGFTPMNERDLQALRDRVKPHAGDGRYELYKLSLKFDNPEARKAHGFPIDMQQREVRELLEEAGK